MKQAGEALLDHLTQTAQALLFTMATSPWTVREIRDNGNTPVPDTLLPLVVQPPPVPTDVLDNGNPGSPGGTPVPQSESPEPGTLIGGLLGAGAVAYRYLRRRRGTATPEGGASHLGVSEGDLVVA